MHYVDWMEKGCVELVLKGGGSENMSRQYSLPDSAHGAGRDLARDWSDGSRREDHSPWREDCVASARPRFLLRHHRLYVLGVPEKGAWRLGWLTDTPVAYDLLETRLRQKAQ